ncbi:MAG TPA: xylulokinase [Bauldia sp.]|nr:xylulokinase [Bauldia sp.]
MHLLGIDIGTSAVKAVLVDAGQRIVAQATAPVATAQPRPGWSEQEPEDWWRATLQAVAVLRADPAFADVRAVGLSGQMHAAVMLDQAGQAIRPAIIWNDGRAVAECRALAETVPDIANIAGVIPMPGFTAPKLMWLRAHEAQDFRRMRHVALAKDVVRLRLTGDIATDMTDAAGTLMLDEARRDWSAPILQAVGVEPRQMPQVLEGSAPSGQLRPAIAAEWGLAHPVIVAGGGGDSAAGAAGIGAIAEGDSLLSLGTSAQIFVTRDRYQPRPETLIHAFAHVLPGRWFEQAAMLNGAGCLDWIARVLGVDVDALAGEVEAHFAAPSRLMFLPYLAGERTPLNDPGARGAFAGLEYATSRRDLAQAVMEGVAFALLEGQSAFAVQRLDPLPVIGGGTRSRVWMRIIAAVLGRTVLRVAGSESGPAFGAARLARLALTGEAPEVVCIKPPVMEAIAPDPLLHDQYAARFTDYRALYAALRRVRAPTADRRPAATP